MSLDEFHSQHCPIAVDGYGEGDGAVDARQFGTPFQKVANVYGEDHSLAVVAQYRAARASNPLSTEVPGLRDTPAQQ